MNFPQTSSSNRPIAKCIVGALRWAVFLFALIVLPAGCSIIQKPSEVDRSFLTQQPCASPCWYTLEPGKSSTDEVRTLLRELPFVNQARLRESRSSWLNGTDALIVSWWGQNPTSYGQATISGDILQVLSVPVDYELTLEKAIQILGSPVYVEYGPYSGEQRGTVLELAWPNRGVTASYVNTSTDALYQSLHSGKKLSRNQRIERFSYAVPEAFNEKPSAGFTRIPWSGFEN